jgi:MFS family permease
MEVTTQLPAIKAMPSRAPMGAVNSRARQARLALSALFFADGLTFGTWAALIPSFQQKFQLPPQKLSFVLLAMIAGAMVSMPLVGRMLHRTGSHRIASPAAFGFPAMLVVLAFAPGYTALIGAAVLFGMWKGALDISINSQAITVENAMAQPIMGGFQGCWSLGGLTAASLLTLLMNAGFTPTQLMVGMAGVLVTLASLTFGRLIPDQAVKKAVATAPVKGAQSSQLWWLGVLAFLALFSEGVMFDWSAVYARTVGGMSVALAPCGFAAFALCMATGRFLGDYVTAKLGAVAVLRLSGFVIAGGIAVAVLGQHHWPVILTGLAMVGLGTANTVPVLFGVAGRLEGRGTGASLAAVTTMGYLGFLAGPPLVGFIAAATSLPVALISVIVSGVVIATLGVAIVRGAMPKAA